MTDTGFPTLSKAPITEALIDIQVRSHELPTIETLQSVAQSIQEEFPLQVESRHATININLNSKETESSMGQEPQGFLVHTEDKLYAAQIMHNRFSLSRLTPYIDWNDLREQSERIWAIYRDITKSDRVVRLAVRYINRLLLPVSIDDFSEYFTKPIEIPDGLPQGLASYMIRAVIPEPESESVAVVQQVLEGVTPENLVSIIFDIDAFKSVDFAADSDDEIWLDLENLREYKNRIFFKNLTEKAIQLYI